MNTELHSGLHEVEVNACNLGVDNALGHCLGSNTAVQRVSVNQLAVLGTSTVCLENVDAVHRELGLALSV
jgi:hypothetical protein